MGVAESRRIAGVVLAGGLSRRMGRDKAGVLLAGRPLVAHALAILRPQVAMVAVNANGPLPHAVLEGAAVLPDGRSDFPGPLAGIEAALAFGRSAGFELVATIPVDCPFLPGDLVAVLAAGLGTADLAAVAESREGRHPVVALWRTAALDAVSQALHEDVRAVRDLLSRLPHSTVRFDDDEAFANVNTPADLAWAEERLRER